MIARPRINAGNALVGLSSYIGYWTRAKKLTMNVALALVGLHDEEVGCVSGNMVLVTGSVAAQDFLHSFISSARVPQQTGRGK